MKTVLPEVTRKGAKLTDVDEGRFRVYQPFEERYDDLLERVVRLAEELKSRKGRVGINGNAKHHGWELQNAISAHLERFPSKT